MVKVGDHIRLSSMKGPDREGVVTAVTGPLVRVRWPSDQETTLVPAPGTLSVWTGPRTRTRKKETAKATTGKRKSAASSSATPKKRDASQLKADERIAPAGKKSRVVSSKA